MAQILVGVVILVIFGRLLIYVEDCGGWKDAINDMAFGSFLLAIFLGVAWAVGWMVKLLLNF